MIDPERPVTPIGPGQLGTAGSPQPVSPPEGELLRRAYSDRALAQVPRLLSLQDRNEFSRTYGCFNREYWLCRTLDFPSSIAQFGVQSLALAYTQPFPDNPYYQNPKILLWALAAIDYWIGIQRPDGSFDEFYPNERGWAGPTGFLVYAMCDSYRLLDGHVPRDLDERFRTCVARAARFLAKYDEPGVLANHHAMAVLPVYEAYRILGEKELLRGFHTRLDDFLANCREEGWCLEYDGADIGYLSATVSFLGKLKKLYTDERIEGVIRRAVDFCSYFVFPDGHYGGSLGSRQTLHFYPHGFELAAPENPTAAAVAEAMLRHLWAGRLVPPEIQEDRYFLYRIPELLQSWVDWKPRPATLPVLPSAGPPFARSWPGAGIHVRRTPDAYLAVNLAKGGVLKIARTDETPRLVVSDCGIIAQTADGKVVTSQWIDAEHRIRGLETTGAAGDLEVGGALHYVVMKVFTPWRMIAFRLFMLIFGWNTAIAYWTKGWIRRLLMTKSGAARSRFRRTVRFGEGQVTVIDRIERGGGPAFKKVKIGDDFSVRYVPQSRYFQRFELGVKGSYLSPEDIERLNREGSIEIARVLDFKKGLVGYESGETD
jgi:hypothetical protein